MEQAPEAGRFARGDRGDGGDRAFRANRAATSQGPDLKQVLKTETITQSLYPVLEIEAHLKKDLNIW